MQSEGQYIRKPYTGHCNCGWQDCDSCQHSHYNTVESKMNDFSDDEFVYDEIIGQAYPPEWDDDELDDIDLKPV